MTYVPGTQGLIHDKKCVSFEADSPGLFTLCFIVIVNWSHELWLVKWDCCADMNRRASANSLWPPARPNDSVSLVVILLPRMHLCMYFSPSSKVFSSFKCFGSTELNTLSSCVSVVCTYGWKPFFSEQSRGCASAALLGLPISCAALAGEIYFLAFPGPGRVGFSLGCRCMYVHSFCHHVWSSS